MDRVKIDSKHSIAGASTSLAGHFFGKSQARDSLFFASPGPWERVRETAFLLDFTEREYSGGR
ncbi:MULTISPECIES: hypothetical protein [Microcoleaceae]|uniref:hypothetical protein n=1 Tax=Microcoleaceae TaxID=1892252 RepID=UPI001882A37D|nr:hypothetical protein [Tychonema sp. LEGE 06208]MBE9161511.1 hypothetical protein [Tychonema sp. LEGE 06208]